MNASILLVEDDLAEARRLESALSYLGHHITLAEDGDAALARLEQDAFDVVLLDLVLPGLDGMGVLRAMKARGIAVPVVVAVTPSGLDGARSALKAGARDFVVKPAGALRLEVAIANAVAAGRPREQAPHVEAPAAGSGNVVRLADHVAAVRAQDEAFDREEGFARVDGQGHVRPLALLEAEAIRFALAHYRGRMSEVARRLGIGRSTLYRKMGELGVTSAEPAAPHFVAAE